MIGRALAHYKIVEKIGSGGMGDVYLAEDTKLARQIALKVLPPDMASDERRERFEREAKAIASLDHPNIVHVHSVEQVGGVHFITMQLVHGKTLTELLPKDGLALDDFWDIAIPLADAIAAAHRAGITHRDLKPDNVMVSHEGRVKVLDFGLAKAMRGLDVEHADSALPTLAKTAEGAIVGTVDYMSPEQAAGKPVDSRSDIFSLGIIFYEMLAGRRPFGGDTPAEVLSSVIREAPLPVKELRDVVPHELSKLVQRCLAKDPMRRAQSALDIRNELEAIRADASAEPRDDSASKSRSVAWMWVAAALALALAASVILVVSPRKNAVLRLANPIQITRSVGVEDLPVLSPDGEMVAYQSGSPDRSVDSDIWVAQVFGGQPVNRTADLPGLQMTPSWSPDGREIAFTSRQNSGDSLFVMPVLAGSPRRLGAASSSPQWSKDGSELAYLTRDDSGAGVLEIRSMPDGDTRRLSLPGGNPQNRNDLRWSPDGRFFAYIEGGHSFDANRLWLVRTADGDAFPLTEGRVNDHSPSWSPDSRAVYYVSNRGGSRDLWQQRLTRDGRPDGDPEPMTVGVGMREATMSSDGTKLAYSKGGLFANVWRIPILEDRPATWADAEQITFDEAYIEHIDLSPDGRYLVVNSDRAGNADIWTLSVDGGDMRQLTTDLTPDWGPRWSPDGKQIAYYSFRTGNRDIWVVPADGGSPRALTSDPEQDWFPAWSPDGREIAFGSNRNGDMDLWVAPVDGGDARLLASLGYLADWSPDGEWIAFGGGRRIRADGSGVEQIVNGLGGNQSTRWSRDGTHVYFARGDDTTRDLWTVSVADGKERRLSALDGRRGFLPVYAPVGDGNHLYFTWAEEIGDIWVMDVVE